MARALKLKSLRDREAIQNPETPRFAHDLDARKESVAKAIESDMQIPITSALKERARDIKDLEQKITTRKHIKNIQKVLAPDIDFTESNPKRKIITEKPDSRIIRPEVNRFTAPAMMRRKRRGVIIEPSKEALEAQRIKEYNDSLEDTAEYEIPLGSLIQSRKEAKKRKIVNKVVEQFVNKKVKKTEELEGERVVAQNLTLSRVEARKASLIRTRAKRALKKKEEETRY
jgi:hypothetical protein